MQNLIFIQAPQILSTGNLTHLDIILSLPRDPKTSSKGVNNISSKWKSKISEVKSRVLGDWDDFSYVQFELVVN